MAGIRSWKLAPLVYSANDETGFSICISKILLPTLKDIALPLFRSKNVSLCKEKMNDNSVGLATAMEGYVNVSLQQNILRGESFNLTLKLDNVTNHVKVCLCFTIYPAMNCYLCSFCIRTCSYCCITVCRVYWGNTSNIGWWLELNSIKIQFNIKSDNKFW